MELKKGSCASCGAPISLPEDIERLNWTFCGIGLLVQRGDGFIALKVAEKITDAIQTSGAQINSQLSHLRQQEKNLIARIQSIDQALNSPNPQAQSQSSSQKTPARNSNNQNSSILAAKPVGGCFAGCLAFFIIGIQ